MSSTQQNFFTVEKINRCFYCQFEYDQPRVGLPLSYSNVNQMFQTWGSFCSYECCMTYMKNHVLHYQKTDLLKSMYRLEYGHGAPPLGQAPPFETLAIFGGKLSYKEFQEKTNYSYKINKFRMCHHPSVIAKTNETATRDDYLKRIML